MQMFLSLEVADGVGLLQAAHGTAKAQKTAAAQRIGAP
jgi:hypothetical protein